MSYIGAAQRHHAVTATSVLNFVLSDGCTLIATRYVYPESEAPASLYYAEGECPSHKPSLWATPWETWGQRPRRPPALRSTGVAAAHVPNLP